MAGQVFRIVNLVQRIAEESGMNIAQALDLLRRRAFLDHHLLHLGDRRGVGILQQAAELGFHVLHRTPGVQLFEDLLDGVFAARDIIDIFAHFLIPYPI